METPEDSQQFKMIARLIRYELPYVDAAFQKKITTLSWVTVANARRLKDILPLPDIDQSELIEFEKPRSPYGIPKLKTLETITEERKQKWQKLSEDWYKDSKLIIYEKKDQLRKKFQEGLDEWNTPIKTTALTADKLVEEWSLANRKLNVSQLEWLSITNKMTGGFLAGTANKRKTDFGLTDQPSATDQNIGPAITNRERTLILCYEGRDVIKKGEPNYKHYITFATPSKRIAYPNESLSKRKSLITSIEAILPLLSKKALKQADTELITLRLQISNPVATG